MTSRLMVGTRFGRAENDRTMITIIMTITTSMPMTITMMMMMIMMMMMMFYEGIQLWFSVELSQ